VPAFRNGPYFLALSDGVLRYLPVFRRELSFEYLILSSFVMVVDGLQTPTIKM